MYNLMRAIIEPKHVVASYLPSFAIQNIVVF